MEEPACRETEVLVSIEGKRVHQPHLVDFLRAEVGAGCMQSETTATGNALSITRSSHVYANQSAHNSGMLNCHANISGDGSFYIRLRNVADIKKPIT
jgi:hypothetical protein